MKHLAFFFSLALCLSACGNNTPKGIATQFLDCLVTKDYSKAVKYCTPRGAAFVNMIGSMDNGKQSFGGYTILSDSIVGDRAWVTYEMGKGGEKATATLELSKIDGKWKVDPTMRK